MNQYYNSNIQEGEDPLPVPPEDTKPMPPEEPIPVPPDQTPFYKKPLVWVVIISIIIAIIALFIYMRSSSKSKNY